MMPSAEKEDEAPHRTGKSRSLLIGGPQSDVTKIHPRLDPEDKGGEGQLEQPAWGQCEKQWSLHVNNRKTNFHSGLGNKTEDRPAVKKTPHCLSGRWLIGREDPRSQPPYIDQR